MAPPGVNTCFDHLGTVTFASYFSPNTTLKAMTSRSSMLLSPHAAVSLPQISLCKPHWDHDYVLKPQTSFLGVVDSNAMCDLSVDISDNSGCGDAMLSSCAIDFEKGGGESTDTDFLKDLDDLNFSFDDLNPCWEVAMEDSFQDFIDSALEQSYSTCVHDMPADNEALTRGQDATILSKEQFLEFLDLRPTQDNSIDDNVLSPSSTLLRKASCSDTILCASDGPVSETADSSTPNVYVKNVNSNDRVPTRQCSCLSFESEFKAVYSIAHPTKQENVRTCSSTIALSKEDDSTECSHEGRTSEVRMSPLCVDTISGAASCSFQSSSKDCTDVVMEEDSLQGNDRETTDIMTWLHESQQEFQQQTTDNNNSHWAHTDELSAVAEMPNQNMMTKPSLDLESFVDLEDFEVDVYDKEAHTNKSHTCESPSDRSECVSNSSSISPLKLSVLTELADGSEKFIQDSYSHRYSDSSLSQLLSPNSSDISHNVFSPALSISDSNQSPFSPQRLRSMDLLFSSHYEDTVYDTAVKSPLALLNLFSDENASSLLHSDSAVPSIRFM